MNTKEQYHAAYSAYRKIASTPGIPQDARQVWIDTPDYITDAVVASRGAYFFGDKLEWRLPGTYIYTLQARAWHRRNFPQEYK